MLRFFSNGKAQFATAGIIIKPMTLSLAAPIWVDTASALQRLAELLSRESHLAVDTEANSLHAFQERVCLIQFSTQTADYLVDPLALDDLTYLAPIFSDPNIEKIFHAAEYDVLGLQRDFDFSFTNIFDTMLAARTLGYKQVGLGNLLAEKFCVDVDKHNQKADWGQRPLAPSMIDYARYDTHYLIALRNLLEAELREKGRWELAHEDFLRYCFVNNGNNHRPARGRWERIDGRQDLSPRQQTILNELCINREKLAERLNRPLFKVLDDRSLLKVAQTEPRSMDQLPSLGLTERQIQRFGRSLLEAVERGENAPIVHATETERMPDAALNRLNRLKNWRKQKAEALGVESDVILPRVYMFALAEQNPRSAEALDKVLAESPWRLENFGPEILKVLGVKTAIP
jgi:ribonuclease D